MFLLRIEHSVPDYETWKTKAFDSDPLGREKSGVTRHRVYRPVDDTSYVFIDLEFTTKEEAIAMLARLEVMWGNVMDRFGWTESPKTKIVYTADDQQY